LALAGHRELLRKIEIVVLAVGIVGLFALFGFAVSRAVAADVTRCASPLPSGSPIGVELAVVSLAGFGLGRLVALARKWINQVPAVADIETVRTGGPLQGALAGFLIMATVLLGYETYALAHSVQAPPITEYVRCAAAHYPALSAAAAGAVSMLLGNWLWYPTR
jgi:hypothetical protein